MRLHMIPNLTHLEKNSKVHNVFKMRCHNAFIEHAVGTCSNCYYFYHVWGFYQRIHFLISDISLKLSVLISSIFIFIEKYFIYIFPGRRGSGRLPLIPYSPIGQPLYEKKIRKYKVMFIIHVLKHKNLFFLMMIWTVWFFI